MTFRSRTSLVSLGLLCLCALFLPGVTAQAQNVTFSDGTFNHADWSLIFETSGSGSASATQVVSGGNPGSWWQVENVSEDSYVAAYSYMNAARYNPSVSGAIAGIDISFDHFTFQVTPFSVHGQGVGLALRQNGKNYYGPFDISYPPTWKTLSWTMIEADQMRTFTDPNDHPDFSSTGSEVTLGIWNYNVKGAYRTTGSGFDNFSVSVTTTPEPGAWLILASAVVPLILRRRRVRPASN